jgi:hypothetical protein
VRPVEKSNPTISEPDSVPSTEIHDIGFQSKRPRSKSERSTKAHDIGLQNKYEDKNFPPRKLPSSYGFRRIVVPVAVAAAIMGRYGEYNRIGNEIHQLKEQQQVETHQFDRTVADLHKKESNELSNLKHTFLGSKKELARVESELEAVPTIREKMRRRQREELDKLEQHRAEFR